MKRPLSNTGDHQTPRAIVLKPIERPLVSSVPAAALVPAADQHPVAVYLAGLAPGSRRTMRSPLQWIARELSRGRQDLQTFAWWSLRYQHVQAIRQLLIDSERAPATVNRYLAAVRGVIQACWRLGLIDGETYHRAIDVAPAKGTRLPRGRALTVAEVAALFASCRRQGSAARSAYDRLYAARDVAILALMFGAGLRRAEVAALDVGDLFRGSVRVLGKGNRQRLVPLPRGAELALSWWIQSRPIGPGPLILPLDQASPHWQTSPRVVIRTLTPQAIYMILRRRAKLAGVRTFSPHDLRRSYVSSLLDAGADLSEVSRLAGHARLETTKRYDRREEQTLARAAAKLRVPF